MLHYLFVVIMKHLSFGVSPFLFIIVNTIIKVKQFLEPLDIIHTILAKSDGLWAVIDKLVKQPKTSSWISASSGKQK